MGRTYADVTDAMVLNTPQEVWDGWASWERGVFAELVEDPATRFGSLVNVGAGRKLADTEISFVDRFESLILVEPDELRCAELRRNLGGRSATIVQEGFGDLGSGAIPQADFVLCKYVLQHLPTGLVATAVAELVSLMAPGGTLGVFTSYSDGDAYFRLNIAPDASDMVPWRIRRRLTESAGALTAEISRKQFDAFLAQKPEFPLIATHHFSRAELLEHFAGLDVDTADGPFGQIFLRARSNP